MKKSQKESLYSFSKTTYGMLPVLIMAITFMATLVISSPLRDSLLHMRFTVRLPQFSFTNPVIFFIALDKTISQIFLYCISASLSFINSIGTIFTNIIVSLSHIRIRIAYPVITFNFDEIATISLFISQTTLAFFQAILRVSLEIIHFAVRTYFFINFINNTLTRLLLYVVTSTGDIVINETEILTPAIGNFAYIIWQTSIQISIIAGNTIVMVSLFIFHSVLLIITTIYNWLAIGIQIIFTAITKAIDEIIFVIEIPFKVLAHFFDLMKPYLAILGKHINMVGKDFDTGATSLGKATTYMSSSK